MEPFLSGILGAPFETSCRDRSMPENFNDVPGANSNKVQFRKAFAGLGRLSLGFRSFVTLEDRASPEGLGKLQGYLVECKIFENGLQVPTSRLAQIRV